MGHGLVGILGVWVSEGSVVLLTIVPHWGEPVVLSDEERISGQITAVHVSGSGDGGGSRADRVEVASVVIVRGGGVRIGRGKLEERVATVVTHALGSLSGVVVVLDRAVSSVSVGDSRLPAVHAVVVGVGRSVHVVHPVLAKTAGTLAGKAGVGNGETGAGNATGSEKEGVTHLDLEVHVLLSETGHWLLTSHFHSDVGVWGHVGTGVRDVLLLVDGVHVRGPWLVCFEVQVVALVTDGTSFTDETEVLLAGTEGGSVSNGITNGGSTGQTFAVAPFGTLPTDATVSESTASLAGSVQLSVDSGLGRLGFADAIPIVVIISPTV